MAIVRADMSVAIVGVAIVGADFSPPRARRLLAPLQMAQPVRLPGVSYTAVAAYFVTSVTHNRVKAFDISDFGPFIRRGGTN